MNSPCKRVLHCDFELPASHAHVYSCINYKHLEPGKIICHQHGLWQVLSLPPRRCQELAALPTSARHEQEDFRPWFLGWQSLLTFAGSPSAGACPRELPASWVPHHHLPFARGSSVQRPLVGRAAGRPGARAGDLECPAWSNMRYAAHGNPVGFAVNNSPLAFQFQTRALFAWRRVD